MMHKRKIFQVGMKVVYPGRLLLLLVTQKPEFCVQGCRFQRYRTTIINRALINFYIMLK